MFIHATKIKVLSGMLRLIFVPILCFNQYAMHFKIVFQNQYGFSAM